MFDEDRNGPLIEDTFPTVDGLRMRVRSGGNEGPDVVLVHGLGLGSTYMMPTARRLARSCRVHVPDLPGFGESEDPDHVMEFAASADHLAAWMDDAGLQEAAFLGNSLGCNVAVEMAFRHPERVESLVLQGPTMDPSGRDWLTALGRFLLDPQRPVVPLGIREYPRAGLVRIAKTMQMALHHPIEARLPRLRAPTLVVRGSGDRIVPQEWAEKMVALIPRAELRVIPGQPHVLVYTGPLELTRVALPFIMRHHEARGRRQRDDKMWRGKGKEERPRMR